MAAIKKGDTVPTFILPDQDNKLVNMNDFIGSKSVVLFFYPKDETRGCTAQACSFRDSYETFKQKGAEVIGISKDLPASHKNFASHHLLPFKLLSDTGNKVRKMFGVPKTMGVLPGRVTYIIDKKGIVQHVFNSQMQFGKHADEALRIIEQINHEQ